jgi:catechol 2,3-dioxygenase
MTSSLWPARLHHLRRDSLQPERLARFYGELLGDRVESLAKDLWLVRGPRRNLLIGKGATGSVPYFGLQMHDAAQLAAYARDLDALGVRREVSPGPSIASASA